MNVNRFSARTASDALKLVRQSLGDDAVVLSTKPCAEGVEMLAMAHDGLQHIEQLSTTGLPTPTSRPTTKAQTPRTASTIPSDMRETIRTPKHQRSPQTQSDVGTYGEVAQDVEKLSMSTLSFQDYVRDRMLKRRRAALNSDQIDGAIEEPRVVPLRRTSPSQALQDDRHETSMPSAVDEHAASAPRQIATPHQESAVRAQPHQHIPRRDEPTALSNTDHQWARRDQQEMLAELSSMKSMIEERFGALAYLEKLQRRPAQAKTVLRLLDCGFSPTLTRKLADGLPLDATEDSSWVGESLERNLLTDEGELALEDQGGVLALIGPTGVGKTTGTAKIAAAFTAKHGGSNLGLITLDAYRLAAHEQLRGFGRILGVPVHIAHDRTSLEDLLELLASKKLVLIDTAGMAQRDTRTRELLDMLAHPNIKRLLVINAAAQGETTEDVVLSYRASNCTGVALSKMDEAVKLGPALDVLIRHKLKVVGVANGQRVPEDWHRLSSRALVQHALQSNASDAYRLGADEVNLIFTSANKHNPTAIAS